MTNLKSLSEGMFASSIPSNPIPFADGLSEGCKQNGTDWIKSNEAKQILFTLICQSYGTAFSLDSYKEYKRLYENYYHK